MRAFKILFLVLVSFAGFGLFDQKAEAGSNFHLGFGYHHRGYGFYRPYYYRPFGYPYGYYGYGYGYPYYGYGYPYRSYYYGYGEIRTEIKPDEAKVYLDGDYVGVADDFNSWYQRMNVEPGRHRLVFRAQGYQPYAVTMRILPGRDYHIKQQLQPGNDAIPDSEMRLQDSERDHQYSSRDRYRDNDQRRDRERDYDSDRRDEDRYNRDEERYDSNRDPGEYEQDTRGKTMMTFQVEPKDATIYIDGDYYGTADAQNNNEIQVLLSDGTHRIEVVRPGYETFSKDIVVNDKATRSITIQLEKK